MVADASLLKHHAPVCVNALPCASDAEVARKVKSEISQKHDLVWGVLSGFHHACVRMPSSADHTPTVEHTAGLRAAADIVNAHITDVLSACPRNSIVIAVGGQGFSAKVRSMHEAKFARASTWTDADEAALKAASDSLASSCFFTTVV
jgi:hypothetical protein